MCKKIEDNFNSGRQNNQPLGLKENVDMQQNVGPIDFIRPPFLVHLRVFLGGPIFPGPPGSIVYLPAQPPFSVPHVMNPGIALLPSQTHRQKPLNGFSLKASVVNFQREANLGPSSPSSSCNHLKARGFEAVIKDKWKNANNVVSKLSLSTYLNLTPIIRHHRFLLRSSPTTLLENEDLRPRPTDPITSHVIFGGSCYVFLV
ncbi:hypothetical protein L1887_03658 [Cichorium endivia]|nr:hypothetical protein L1887_03658 [Cichorium endivia]